MLAITQNPFWKNGEPTIIHEGVWIRKSEAADSNLGMNRFKKLPRTNDHHLHPATFNTAQNLET
jgi:hypothetical protein